MGGPVLGTDLECAGQPAQGLLLLAMAQADYGCFMAEVSVFGRLPHGAIQRFQPF